MLLYYWMVAYTNQYLVKITQYLRILFCKELLMANCLECKFFSIDCNPQEEEYKRDCFTFIECSDKKWAMRNGLWDIEDEIMEDENVKN